MRDRPETMRVALGALGGITVCGAVAAANLRRLPGESTCQQQITVRRCCRAAAEWLTACGHSRCSARSVGWV